jgi:Yersinia/Haemophilus virulence surface antigen
MPKTLEQFFEDDLVKTIPEELKSSVKLLPFDQSRWIDERGFILARGGVCYALSAIWLRMEVKRCPGEENFMQYIKQSKDTSGGKEMMETVQALNLEQKELGLINDYMRQYGLKVAKSTEESRHPLDVTLAVIQSPGLFIIGVTKEATGKGHAIAVENFDKIRLFDPNLGRMDMARRDQIPILVRWLLDNVYEREYNKGLSLYHHFII